MVAADAGWWIASYLAGSLPTGFVVGRMRGVDLRKAGSGNIGASNGIGIRFNDDAGLARQNAATLRSPGPLFQ